MDLNKLKEDIGKIFDESTWLKLSDEALMPKFLLTDSFKKQKAKLADVLSSYKIDANVAEKIIFDYKEELIKAGAKGAVRGKEFNDLVEVSIKNIGLNPQEFEVNFEKDLPDYKTDERPDFYIKRLSDGKALIGMNQVDLWGGGQQTNRASKYLKHNETSSNVKIICVIAKLPKIITDTDPNKVDALLFGGLEKEMLHYISGLHAFITDYFK